MDRSAARTHSQITPLTADERGDRVARPVLSFREPCIGNLTAGHLRSSEVHHVPILRGPSSEPSGLDSSLKPEVLRKSVPKRRQEHSQEGPQPVIGASARGDDAARTRFDVLLSG